MTQDTQILTLSPSPHVKYSGTTTTIMRDVLIALTPAVIWSVVVFGLKALLLTALSVVFCVGFEFGYQKLMKKPVTVTDLSAAVTGVILSLNLPVTCSWWALMLGDFFAIIIVKQLFGGIGKNIVNPAIAARIFMFVSWPSQLSSFKEPMSDAVSSATPLASLKLGELPAYSLSDTFLGFIPGCMGEVSALMILIGAIYLFARRIITWHIPVSFLATVAVIALIFPTAGSRIDSALFALLSGGLLFGAIFMATDYTTSPVTFKGRIIFGVGCGLLTVMIRYFGAYPEGVSFAIMIMNLLVWYIDRVTLPRPFGSKDKS